jgi:ABC-type transport system involved in multi-copper enzyme maturation permease subunit
MTIWTIAALSLREASRRKLFLAVFILTAVLALFTGWGLNKLVNLPCDGHPCSHVTIVTGVSTILILLVFMFSFVLALGGAFIAAPAIWADVESGIVLSMLPRPIRRSDFVLGKWLGVALVLALYAALACGMEFLIVRVATGYVPPHPILAILFVIVQSLVIITLAILGSTRLPGMTTGIIALLLFGFTWIAGIVGSIGANIGNKPIADVGTISSLLLPTDGLWRGALYNMEPAVLQAANEAAAGGGRGGNDVFMAFTPPTTGYMIWVVVWIVGMLGLAIWSFQRKEI